MNRGYVRLWRKSLDAGWIRNHKLWVFWSYCLLKASYKEYDAIVGLQIVHLSPGQFVFGLKKASQETGLTIREIRTILDFLKKAGNLTIKTTNKFSIISIVNWHTYQPQEDENDTQNDKQVANKGQHTRSIEVKNKTYVTFFENFWSTYPSRNGKKLGKGETLKKFSQLKETDLPLVLQAVKNYATSEDVKNGTAIDAIVTYGSDPTEGPSAASEAKLIVKASDVAKPTYRDVVVIGSTAYRVQNIIKGQWLHMDSEY